jgi:hypothetical protein
LKTALLVLVLVAGAATAGLWCAPLALPSGDVTLSLRVDSTTARLSDKPDIRIYLHIGSPNRLYITTNLDPFVGGAGMFRNYYLLVSGRSGASQSTHLFLDALQLPMSEQQMLQTGVLLLLEPGRTYSGRMPIDTWSEVVPEPGQYRLSGGYRGTGPTQPLSFSILESHLESNAVAVIITADED